MQDYEPLPEWVNYHNTAENMHCPPWEMFEDHETQPPKWWWRHTRMLLDAGRNEGERKRHEMSKKR